MLQQLQVQHQHASACAANPPLTEGTYQSTWGLVSGSCRALTIVADAQLYQQLHDLIRVCVLLPQGGLVALIYHKSCREHSRLNMSSVASLAVESSQAPANIPRKDVCRGRLCAASGPLRSPVFVVKDLDPLFSGRGFGGRGSFWSSGCISCTCGPERQASAKDRARTSHQQQQFRSLEVALRSLVALCALWPAWPATYGQGGQTENNMTGTMRGPFSCSAACTLWQVWLLGGRRGVDGDACCIAWAAVIPWSSPYQAIMLPCAATSSTLDKRQQTLGRPGFLAGLFHNRSQAAH